MLPPEGAALLKELLSWEWEPQGSRSLYTPEGTRVTMASGHDEVPASQNPGGHCGDDWDLDWDRDWDLDLDRDRDRDRDLDLDLDLERDWDWDRAWARAQAQLSQQVSGQHRKEGVPLGPGEAVPGHRLPGSRRTWAAWSEAGGGRGMGCRGPQGVWQRQAPSTGPGTD